MTECPGILTYITQAKLALVSCLLLVLVGCKTDDITPTASIAADDLVLDAAGGTLRIRAKLNGISSKQINIPVSFAGTAVINVDYSISSNSIVVPDKSDEGFITLTGIDIGDTTRKFIEIRLLPNDNAIIVEPSVITIELTNCNADRDNDGVPNCQDECPDEPGPAENNGCPWLGLIFNEVLYDPPPGLSGDANGDGTRDPLGDEFAEIYNSGPTALNLAGYTLSDAAMVRHVFPEGTILPSKGVIVVFGSGTPTGTFGGAIVQTASNGQLNLNNSGDVLTLRNTSNVAQAVFDINPLLAEPDESYTRSPDILGNFVRHSSVTASNGRLFSPGTRLNGSPF